MRCNKCGRLESQYYVPKRHFYGGHLCDGIFIEVKTVEEQLAEAQKLLGQIREIVYKKDDTDPCLVSDFAELCFRNKQIGLLQTLLAQK